MTLSMDSPCTPRKPSARKRRADMESHYFPSPSPSPSKRRKCKASSGAESPNESQVLCAPLPTKSRFFDHPADYDALISNPAFNAFYQEFTSAWLELYYAKPILVQEHLAADPWKLVIAVTLLNKTAGRQSIPVLFDILDRWPTPNDLAEAPLSVLLEMLKPLGFGDMRSRRLVDISQSCLSNPPQSEVLHPSRGYTTGLFLNDEGSVTVRKVQYPPTPISHLPGCGPYALDSYRIFCTAGEEWKAVRPTDKELVKYLQWRWAVKAYRKWDPVHGPGDLIELDYVCELTAKLTKESISHQPRAQPVVWLDS
ncbi:DNA glycosylase [Daedaleopsis nitida]|nr:DNA glycosylase [Daedaleopsis nitida]